MKKFSFIPLGVGDAFSKKYYSASMILEADDKWLLIDCPHPIRKILYEAGQIAEIPDLDIDKIFSVALTHLHADHVSGLEGLGFFCYFALKKKAHITLHPEVLEDLWDKCLSAGMGQNGPDIPPEQRPDLDMYFDHTTLDYEGPVQIGPFSIECRRTIHSLPTTAFKITANNRTLSYSADTSFDPTLIDWLSSADVIVHEANYGVHTPYHKLAKLPELIRNKMYLTHYPDNFKQENSIIKLLRQGHVYTV